MIDSATLDLSELGLAQSHLSETLQDQQMSQLLKLVGQASQETDPLDDSTVTLSPNSHMAVGIDRSDTMINASAIDLDYGLDESKVTEIINRGSSPLEEEAATNDTQQNLIQSLPTSVLDRKSRESSRKHVADDSELYVFDEDLLSELGLSSVRDAQDDTSEIDSSILQQLEHFTQQIDWDDATESNTLTQKHEIEQSPIKRDLVEYGDTDRFIISEFEGVLISDDDSLTASNTELIEPTSKVEPIDPLLYPFVIDSDDDVKDLLVGGERGFVDLATTPWLKPEKSSSDPKAQIDQLYDVLEPLTDHDDDIHALGTPTSLDSPIVSVSSFVPLHEEEVHTTHQNTSLTPRYLAPPDLPSLPPDLSSLPPDLSSLPPTLSSSPPTLSSSQDMSEFSALRRLAEGELNLDTFPNPIPSSRPQNEVDRQAINTPRVKRAARSSSRSIPWLIGISCIIGSYLTLVSAFHSKSAHLIQHASIQAHTLNPSVYQDLEHELYLNARHPIGQSIDFLRPLLSTTHLCTRRDELFHKLAWISVTRWVLHGESSQKEEAMYALIKALRGNAQRFEGRAALALALWMSGQDLAAIRVIEALPKSEWRRDLVLGWINWKADKIEQSQVFLKSSHKLNPNNEFTAHLLGLVKARQGIAIAMPYLQQLQHRPPTPEELGVYLADLTSDQNTWATIARLSYINAQSPQLKRELLRYIIPVLLKRGDRVSLQSLASQLKLTHSSPSPLLLPALMISLTELDFETTQKILDEMKRRFEDGVLRGDDLIIAQSMWASLVRPLSPSKIRSLHDLSIPKLAQRLGKVAGRSVSELITKSYDIHPRLLNLTRALISLSQGKWFQLERIALEQSSAKSTDSLWSALSALSRTNVSSSHHNAQATLEILTQLKSSFESALLIQTELLSGVMMAYVDPLIQGQFALSRYEKTTGLPLFKWLARSWRCETLKNVTALGRWISTCESALQLNARDIRSLQQLALALEEIGRVEEAQKLIQDVSLLSLDKDAQHLKLRFHPEYTISKTPPALHTYQELLSAERQMRLSTFVRLAKQEFPRLSRYELYRASWVMSAFDSERFEHKFIKSAINKGSIRAKLNDSRMKFLKFIANNQKNKPDQILDSGTRFKANAESRLTHFVAIYDALSCLARNQALDLHHYHPSLRLNESDALQGFKRVRIRQSTRRCQSKITDAITSFNSSQFEHLPVIVLSQVQLLISVGQKEQAYQLLASLIVREPTLIEARIAQALLLMRSGGKSKVNLIREALGPLLDPAQGARIPLAMYQRLESWGGL
jgi:hypothetical protein